MQHCAEMDGKAFAKMCKDCKLLGRGLTPTDADLVFAKVKPKGGRKICFSSFAAALEALAAKKVRAALLARAVSAAASGALQQDAQAQARRHVRCPTHTRDACALASLQGCAVEEVVAAIVLAGGPVSNATAKAEAVRLHDDKV